MIQRVALFVQRGDSLATPRQVALLELLVHLRRLVPLIVSHSRPFSLGYTNGGMRSWKKEEMLVGVADLVALLEEALVAVDGGLFR